MRDRAMLLISIFGNQRRLAIALGVSSQTVNDWVLGKRRVPPSKAVAIERLTNGLVVREELVSNWEDFWPELVALNRLAQKEREPTHHVPPIDTLPSRV